MNVIDASKAFGIFVEGGKSSAFVEAMNGVRDTEAFLDDEEGFATYEGRDIKRYRPGDVDQLECLLVSRGREARDVRLQLAQYVFVLDRLALSESTWLEHYFSCAMTGTASAAHFRAWFQERGEGSDCPTIRVAAEKLLVPGRDGKLDYDLDFKRIPVIDALLNFIMTYAGEIYEAVKELFDEMVQGAHDYQQAQQTANAMARILEPYLDQHLRTRAELERFKAITGFVESQSGDGILDFNDETILGFWQTAALDTKTYGDFKGYTRAVHAIIDVRDALSGAEYQRNRRLGTKSLGSEFEHGEIDPVSRDQAVEAGVDQDSWHVFSELVDDPSDPLDYFREGGEGFETKLVNPTECRRLANLITMKHFAAAYIRSLIRAEVFGFAQNQITQARKNKDQARVQALIGLGFLDQEAQERAAKPAKNRPQALGHDAYSEQFWEFSSMREQLKQRLLACYHVARHWQPDDHDPDELLDRMEDWDRQQDLAARLEAARKAFEALNRKGIRDAMESHRMGERVIDAMDPLSRIVSALEVALHHLESLETATGFEAALAADRPRFAKTFAEIQDT